MRMRMADLRRDRGVWASERLRLKGWRIGPDESGEWAHRKSPRAGRPSDFATLMKILRGRFRTIERRVEPRAQRARLRVPKRALSFTPPPPHRRRRQAPPASAALRAAAAAAALAKGGAAERRGSTARAASGAVGKARATRPGRLREAGRAGRAGQQPLGL